MALNDPRTYFKKVDPPEQIQEHPGLDRDLEPQADIGLETYIGHGRLKGRKALITGGDSGIGAAAAIAYAREGADVAISYLPEEQADADRVIEAIEEVGQKAVALPGDLMELAQCQHIVEETVKQLGGLDILVNNASRQIWHDGIENITDEDFDLTMKSNIYSAYRVTKAALKHLQPGSSIIFTSSIQAYQPSETLLDYAMTKAAMNNLSKGLAQELAPKGIRVNAIARDRSGLRYSRATDSRRRRSRPSVRQHHLAVPAIPSSLREPTSSSHPTSPPMLLERRSASPAASPPRKGIAQRTCLRGLQDDLAAPSS